MGIVSSGKRFAIRKAVSAALLLFANGVYADVVVVVGAQSPIGSLTRDQVVDIYMGRVTALPGGGTASPLDQRESNIIREEFYTKIVGKSAAQAKAYWSKLAFTGRGTPPKENSNSQEIKKTVATNPSALGYIEKSAIDASVKVVFPID